MANRRRGWVLSDAVLAIGILAMLCGMVAAEMAWRAKAARRLQDIRLATDRAEQVLTDLEQGSPRAAGNNGAIRIENLPGASPPNHYQWVRVVATQNGQSAALIGLVKSDSAGGA